MNPIFEVELKMLHLKLAVVTKSTLESPSSLT